MTVKDIRNNTTDLLIAAQVAEGKIFNSKVLPNYNKDLPAVVVFSDLVQATNLGKVRPTFMSSVSLKIIVYFGLSDDWADGTDDVVQSILNTLMSDTLWCAQFTAIESYSVEYSSIDNGEQQVGMATMSINAKVLNPF